MELSKVIIQAIALIVAVSGSVFAYYAYKSETQKVDYAGTLLSIELTKKIEEESLNLKKDAGAISEYREVCAARQAIINNGGMEKFRQESRGAIHGKDFSTRLDKLPRKFWRINSCIENRTCDENLMRQNLCGTAAYWSELVFLFHLDSGYYKKLHDRYEPLLRFTNSCPLNTFSLFGAPCGGIVIKLKPSPDPEWIIKARERFKYNWPKN